MHVVMYTYLLFYTSFSLCVDGNLSNMLVDEQNDPAPLDPDQSLYYFRQLLLGVKFLHDNGVLHLDIKCLNLLIFNEGKTLKLCDFGTAMSIDSLASSSRTHCCMTPLFAAPEVCVCVCVCVYLYPCVRIGIAVLLLTH